MRFTGGKGHEHQVRLRRQRALGALQVRHEHRDEETRQRLCISDEFRRIRELRQAAGGHERAHLDLALAGLVRGADPFDFVPGREHRLDALQAVAQANLAYHAALR